MNSPRKDILILCEGLTEINKIRAINDFLRSHNLYDINYHPENLEGVQVNNYCSKIKAKIKKVKNEFNKIYVWLDFDIFQRAGMKEENVKKALLNINISKKVKKGIYEPKIELLFNHKNGEDCHFLFHNDKSLILKYQALCEKSNHFETPLHADDYLKLITKFIPEYRKNNKLEINIENIQRFISYHNDNDIKFKSDLSVILSALITLYPQLFESK